MNEKVLNIRTGDNPDDIVFDDIPAESTIAKPDLKALNIQQLLEYQFLPREYLLEPILPTQGLAMLYAQRGIGKTHVALNIAFVVACGGSLFGKWSADQSKRVLYIDGEMPGVSLQERLSQIIAAAPDSHFDPNNLILLTNDLQEFGLPDLGTVEGQIAIKSFTENADLIILDNISTLCRAGAENKADDWMVVQQWALRMRAQGRSVLFIHHAGKGGAQRGTSKREDILDTVITLKRPIDYEPSQGAKFEVHFEKARGIKGEAVTPFVAELSTHQGQYTWLLQSLEQSTFEKVVQLSKDGLNPTEMAKELDIHKSSVSRHLKNAKKGEIENV